MTSSCAPSATRVVRRAVCRSPSASGALARSLDAARRAGRRRAGDDASGGICYAGDREARHWAARRRERLGRRDGAICRLAAAHRTRRKSLSLTTVRVISRHAAAPRPWPIPAALDRRTVAGARASERAAAPAPGTPGAQQDQRDRTHGRRRIRQSRGDAAVPRPRRAMTDNDGPTPRRTGPTARSRPLHATTYRG